MIPEDIVMLEAAVAEAVQLALDEIDIFDNMSEEEEEEGQDMFEEEEEEGQDMFEYEYAEELLPGPMPNEDEMMEELSFEQFLYVIRTNIFQ